MNYRYKQNSNEVKISFNLKDQFKMSIFLMVSQFDILLNVKLDNPSKLHLTGWIFFLSTHRWISLQCITADRLVTLQGRQHLQAWENMDRVAAGFISK